MQQTMGNLKLGFKIIIPALVITVSLTSCNEIIRVMDILGMIPPSEPKLELQLEKQAIGEPFSFADYCKEEYDSIFLVYPYFNTEKEDFVNLKMSDKLRRVCNSNSNFDSFSTLLFINDGEVNAFSEISFGEIRLTPPEIPENRYIFPFKQKFILNKDRYVHIYKE
jgi:hypothetical protein